MPVRIDPLTGDMRYDADVVGAVTSVFGRTGAVVAATDDYTWAQIDKTLSDLADLTTRSHTDLADIGTNTHAQIDTHIGDTTIHFLEGAIDHTNLLNIGTNTHAQIDTHIADGTVHFLEGAIDHLNILNIGTNSHSAIDSHIADGTIHFVEGSIDHGSIDGLADDDHIQYLLADGTRALSAAWDAGSFKITAETFESDVAGGTAPFTVASNTLVTNLNADLLDGNEAAAFAAAAHVHAAGDITSGTLAVAQGGTNLASGTDGGILGYTAVGVLASSVLLTANALILGGGAGATPIPLTAGLGTTVTVLHGNAGGEPTWGAVDLTADITGTLPYSNGGTGQTTWAQGDLLYASAADTLALLNVGGANTVLVSNGTVPGWSATLAGLTLTSPTIGDFTNAAHDHEAAGGGGQLDHNAALTNLATGDVHTHYALLAGRSGGQTLIGSTDASEDLTLQSTSDAARGFVIIPERAKIFSAAVSLPGSGVTSALEFPINATCSSSGSLFTCIKGSGTVTFEADPNVFGTSAFFSAAITLQGSGSRTMSQSIMFNGQPTLAPDTDGGTTTTGFNLRTFVSGPVLATTSGAVSANHIDGFYAAGTCNSPWVVTGWHGLHVANPGGAGTITDLTGVDIAALTRGSTSNCSLRSAGTDTQMRHAGPAVFGANAAPTNDSVGLEVQSTTKALLLSRMTQAQRDTLTGVAVADGMCLYNSTTKSVGVRANGSWVATPGWDIVIIKSAYQVVTNNSTLQDDTELQFSVLANEAWIVELLLGMIGTSTTGDGKVGLTASVATFTTSHSNWEGVYYNAAGNLTITTPIGFASTTEAVAGGTTCINGDALAYPVHLIYRFQATANATVKVQFANSTAGAGYNTFMYGGSTLRAKRLIQ